MAASNVRQQIILDVTFEASHDNLNIDLANIATDAVMDVLGGLTAVDTTDEFLPPMEERT